MYLKMLGYLLHEAIRSLAVLSKTPLGRVQVVSRQWKSDGMLDARCIRQKLTHARILEQFATTLSELSSGGAVGVLHGVRNKSQLIDQLPGSKSPKVEIEVLSIPLSNDLQLGIGRRRYQEGVVSTEIGELLLKEMKEARCEEVQRRLS